MQKGTPTSRGAQACRSKSVPQRNAGVANMRVSPVPTQTAPGTFSTLADRLIHRNGRELRPRSLVLFVETLIRPNVHTVYAGAGPGLLAPILDAEQSLPRIKESRHERYRNHSTHSNSSAALITFPSIPSNTLPRESVSTCSSATSSSTCTNRAVTASR